MAMGDSMTAGFQASQRADMHEHRGVSFSIGGDKGAITLPNFMQEVKQNGKLVGPATGSLSLPKVKATCAGSEIDRVCRLSAAVDGSDLQDLMDLQVGYLNHTLNTATWAANISVLQDWKLLTIFSGLDDVVFYNQTDNSKEPTAADLFAHNLDLLLQSVYKAFPRTFVNLMLLPENFFPSVTTARFSCKFFKWYTVRAGIHWTETKDWIPAIKEFNQIILRLAKAWKAKGLDDFGVSVQPFMKEAQLTPDDMDSVDCFHPNLASHQRMAVALWNNMHASSSENKSDDFKTGPQNASCPTAASRLVV